CLVPLELQAQGIAKTLAVINGGIIGITLTVVPLLAGTLSVGEERTSGTQIWNMVLPISIRGQWLLKFTTGLLTCFASQAVALAALSLMNHNVFDPRMSLAFTSPANRLDLVGLSSVVFIAAFWSACAVKGTVRASLLTF